ncbi:uncharacterized protein BDR25DRAFT_357207 [Lindgomyces ingoldianus]|uniref:Uncharacterized protein n=1 Tax=Lindgomyces ingoldianus TaxID=673940 RepID=A0ACB6QPN5_9PLEO|nr:uncharacterized protein BDR25DRAFT_357207 [Lindgomyces ingoldianus]KAF2468840.1 hypothetical protein BDR25DRAFT_357207 [Lindgomyces ingoldianus]
MAAAAILVYRSALIWQQYNTTRHGTAQESSSSPSHSIFTISISHSSQNASSWTAWSVGFTASTIDGSRNVVFPKWGLSIQHRTFSLLKYSGYGLLKDLAVGAIASVLGWGVIILLYLLHLYLSSHLDTSFPRGDSLTCIVTMAWVGLMKNYSA